jgi:HPt (histidine-containing phosphotransfer) domain-containing protein
MIARPAGERTQARNRPAAGGGWAAVTADRPAASDRRPSDKSSSGARAPIINLDAIDMLSAEIGLDGVRETLAVFLQETAGRLAKLRNLSCVADRDTIEIEAHTLKGASGAFGLGELSARVQLLEKGTGALTEQSYRETLDRLEAAFGDARGRIPVEFLAAA